MSGGASRGQDYTSEPAALSEADLKSFRESQAGGKYNEYEVAALNGARMTRQGKWYQGNTDVNGIMEDFQAWVARQNQSNRQHNQYVDAATQFPGRDATILTGPQVSPNQTLLAPSGASPSVLGRMRRGGTT